MESTESSRIEINASQSPPIVVGLPTIPPVSTASPTGMALVAFPEYYTVQGFMWINGDKSGLYETSEPPATSTLAHLLRCSTNAWIQTTSSNNKGRYQFLGVKKGKYYVQFFRPDPPEKCESFAYRSY
jgi:hypothetical protein